MVSLAGSAKHWLAGGVAGILGAILFGVVLQATVPATLRLMIPAMYGLEPSALLGWVLHLVHGAILGIVYALLAQDHQLSRYANNPIAGASVGFFYGLFLWAFLASTLMPVLVNTRSPYTVPFPDVDPRILAGHVAYGVVLGILYPAIGERL